LCNHSISFEYRPASYNTIVNVFAASSKFGIHFSNSLEGNNNVGDVGVSVLAARLNDNQILKTLK